ncbi:MAG: OprO/OprP family phosphate-selective porin [Panacagrimonas sp.]
MKGRSSGAVAVLLLATVSSTAWSAAEDAGRDINIQLKPVTVSAKLGGRIHFDGSLVDVDEDAAFGSVSSENDGFFFRRIRLMVKGKVGSWEYRLGVEGAPSNATGSSRNTFQDVYLAHELGPGQLIFGQRRPFRGMEELTSSNDVTMMERPFASAAGVFAGGRSREFQLGVFYKGTFLQRGTYGFGAYSLRRENTPSTPGTGANGRLSYAPRLGARSMLHFGVSYSIEKPDGLNNDDDAGELGTRAVYAGRRGPNIVLGTTAEFDDANTLGLEFAAQSGPLSLQSEYMSQTLGQGDSGPDQTVDAYYVQLSWMLSGETKPYKFDKGVYGSPEPAGSRGAFELAARYDYADNGDSVAAPEAEAISLGLNWYARKNVRFMLNYVSGMAEQTLDGQRVRDEPGSVSMRAQISF